jgi:transposase
VPDNLRSGVTKPHRYEADVNATYQEMAQHYGVVIIPARSYKPRDKACATDCSFLVGSVANSSRPRWHRDRCERRTDSSRVVMLRGPCDSPMRTHVSGWRRR